MKKISKLLSIICLVGTLSSCLDFLDVIPDDVATIESIFNDKNSAKQYLYTCYSFLPAHRQVGDNPGFAYGGEFSVNESSWIYTPTGLPRTLLETGNNATSPHIDYWSRTKNMFAAIRVCNYFLDNVETIPNLPADETLRWKAEVKFLKAYYHWWLFQMYGPIPIMDTNPGFTGESELAVYRNTKDECGDYIVNLMTEAINSGGLPENISGNETTDLGRVTKAVAMSIKAKVLVTLASDFFNGNHDYVKMIDNRNIPLFSSESDPKRWEVAAQACKEAIDFCHTQGMELYRFKAPTGTVTNEQIDQTLQPAMILYGQLPENSEIIWSQPEPAQGIYSDIQHRYGHPEYLYTGNPSSPTEKRVGYEICGSLGVSLNFAEVFYTKHGVPMEEDKTYCAKSEWFKPDVDFNTRKDHQYVIKEGYQTNNFNLYREPRYYGSIAFRGSLLFGLGRVLKDDMYYFYPTNQGRVNSTGMLARKWVPYTSTPASGVINYYHWPIIRLADLYLLYAEALNECTQGTGQPAPDVYKYVDLVRERAGIPSVEESWTDYSIYSDKYLTKTGMRDIIRQERRIELAFEGHSWFDLRRWRMMEDMFSSNTMRGYNVKIDDNEEYVSTPTVIHTTTFDSKSNLWPIRESELHKDLNLVQNLGWD